MLGLAGCLALSIWSILSYSIPPAYIGSGRMILLIGGGVLIQPAPAQLELGFQMMDADIPGKSFGARLRGWFMFPQSMGVDAWFVPFGLPVAVLTAAFWLIYRRARERPAAGFCAACGYDLTGNVSGVCSECGQEMLNWLSAPKPRIAIES